MFFATHIALALLGTASLAVAQDESNNPAAPSAPSASPSTISASTPATTSASPSSSPFPSDSPLPVPSDVATITWPEKDKWWAMGGTAFIQWKYADYSVVSKDSNWIQHMFLINTDNPSAINMTAYNHQWSTTKDLRFWNGTDTYMAKYFILSDWGTYYSTAYGNTSNRTVWPCFRPTEPCLEMPVYPSTGYQVGIAWCPNVTEYRPDTGVLHSPNNTWSIVWSEKFEIKANGGETFPSGVQAHDGIQSEASPAFSARILPAVAGIGFAAILMAV